MDEDIQENVLQDTEISQVYDEDTMVTSESIDYTETITNLNNNIVSLGCALILILGIVAGLIIGRVFNGIFND